jgi:hypothetical protein
VFLTCEHVQGFAAFLNADIAQGQMCEGKTSLTDDKSSDQAMLDEKGFGICIRHRESAA